MGIHHLRSLVKQTAIYGISSIVGRFLNYLLVPLYTHLIFETQEYGVVTLMYSYVAFLLVLLTYGMETAFFRFYQSHSPSKVLGTSLASISATTLLFVGLAIAFHEPLSYFLGFGGNASFISLMAVVVGLDVLAAIPFALLRVENKAVKFAVIKFINIGINIGLNLFFFLLCPWLVSNGPKELLPILQIIYNPDFGVGYVFVANLVASSITLLLLIPMLLRKKFSFSHSLLKTLLRYALPLMLAGLAGVANDSAGKIMLSQLLPAQDALAQLGIYGASFKIAVLVSLFVQAYRFAADPFFFNNAANPQAPELYARVMKYFVVVCMFVFLGVTFFMDIIQYFVGVDFREGLGVVPILLMANISLGVYFNLSIWFKLTGKTHIGAYIALLGLCVAIGLNLLLIPHVGYYGAAWATAAGYIVMVVATYFTGRKHLPIPYDLPRIVGFIAIAGLLFFVQQIFDSWNAIANYAISIVLLGVFGWVVSFIDPDIKKTIKSLFIKKGKL